MKKFLNKKFREIFLFKYGTLRSSQKFIKTILCHCLFNSCIVSLICTVQNNRSTLVCHSAFLFHKFMPSLTNQGTVNEYVEYQIKYMFCTKMIMYDVQYLKSIQEISDEKVNCRLQRKSPFAQTLITQIDGNEHLCCL